MRRNCVRFFASLLLVASVLSATTPSAAQDASQASKDGFFGAMAKSLTGDVYGDPSRWRELTLRNFFSEGWTQAWVSPPPGGGGAPRQGWLNSFDGVFYRLGVATYGYAHNFLDNGNQNSGLVQFYLPLNQRFEFRLDIPAAVSNRGATGTEYETHFGDLQIVPRFLLSESRDLTQSFNVAFRVPTGDTFNGNGVASITPTYEFWTNWWQGLVLRGGAGFFIPYGHQSIDEVGAHAAFIANLAAGYYFTPHDAAPFGDLVFYLSTNLSQTIDGPSKNTVSLTPGMRTHLGANWYLLMGVEVPVNRSTRSFDYQVLGALMKVF